MYITVQKSLFPKLGYLHESDANLPHTRMALMPTRLLHRGHPPEFPLRIPTLTVEAIQADITSVELALVMQTHTSGTSKWRSALRVLSGWQYI